MRIAYLGPAGTFTEDALGEAIPEGGFEPLRTATIHDAILAVERGEAERALVPIENSLEGSVRPTLDTLAFEALGVTIVGEHDYRVRVHLIAREGTRAEDVEAVLSHPQPLAQCQRFLRESFPEVELRNASSTAAAVRMVSESARPWAALGARAAAAMYGCELLQEGVEDSRRQRHPLRLDRRRRHRGGGLGPLEDLARLLRGRSRPPRRPGRVPERVLRPRHQPHPDRVAAAAAGPRAATCSSAISRGPRSDPGVTEAIAALRTKAASVRILGSYSGWGEPVCAYNFPQLWPGCWYSTRRMSRSTSAR